MITKQRQLRKKRVRARVAGSASRPRLSVYRSNKHMYAQIIDDNSGKTFAQASDKSFKGASKTEKAHTLGKEIAKLAKAKKVQSVVFDRAGYQYHGRVKAVAEGAREGGLQL